MAAAMRTPLGVASADGSAADGARGHAGRTAPLPASDGVAGGALPPADECARLVAAAARAVAWRLPAAGAEAAARVVAARSAASASEGSAASGNGGDWSGMEGRDALYARGLARFEADDLDGAITDFSLVHASAPHTSDAAEAADPLAMPSALGVAAAAHAMALHADAATIACAVSETGFGHPRAHLLAGLAFIAGGRADPGRRSLALCARAARGDARYAHERHAAQRALIGLQFGVTQNEA